MIVVSAGEETRLAIDDLQPPPRHRQEGPERPPGGCCWAGAGDDEELAAALWAESAMAALVSPGETLHRC